MPHLLCRVLIVVRFWEVGTPFFDLQLYCYWGLFKGKGSMGSRGTDCSVIISVSAGGKYEQKSLRDREGPHRSPGPILNHFWMGTQYL